MEASSCIPISLLAETLPAHIQMILSEFLLAHPRAYLQECQGMRSGIIRFHEWRVSDPNQNYAVLGVGRTELDAFFNAYEVWDIPRRLKDAAREGFEQESSER